MSENHTETTQMTPSSTSSPSQDVPKLQRETVVMVNDRGRLGLLIALCSLAGVAVGFGLSNMAASIHGHHCSIRSSAPVVQMASATRARTPTWLGVRIKDHRTGGAYVLSVEPNSPASRAGLQPGDVVTGFAENGCSQKTRDIHTASDLVRMVQSADVGDRSLIAFERHGAERSLRATLEHMPLSIFYSVYGR